MPFVIFGLTLLGVALFHHRALTVALVGLFAAILLGFVEAPSASAGAEELIAHFGEEWVILSNLLLLLLGFAILSN